MKFNIPYLIHLLTLKKGEVHVPLSQPALLVHPSHTSPIPDCCPRSQSLLTRNSICRESHINKSQWGPGSFFGHPPLFPFLFFLKDSRENTFLLLRPFISLSLQHLLLIFNLFYPLSSYPNTARLVQKHRRGPWPSSLLCSVKRRLVGEVSSNQSGKCKYWGGKGEKSSKLMEEAACKEKAQLHKLIFLCIAQARAATLKFIICFV